MEGYIGKILRVNLTDGEFAVEDIDPDLIRQYVGGRGLGTKILYDEIDPAIDPLSPENKLIFLNGPLTGTGAPAGSRYMVITKAPLTNTIACSNCGGSFGPELKQAGYDGIIFEGCSDEPVSLWINNDEVEIRSAIDLWGKTTHETDDLIKAEIEDNFVARDTQIACIGPAGENMSKLACIISNKNRAAGRTGVGAVMGSKKLKAIVVRGTKGIRIADGKVFNTAIKSAMDKLNAGPVTSEALPAFGTPVLVNIVNECNILPTYNWQSSSYENAGKISGETMAETIVTRHKGCFACSIACAKCTEIEDPEFKGKGEGPEFENVILMGSSCGIDNLGAIAKASYLCNELGMDTISVGGTIATAMELFEKGYITEKDAGMKLNFGNAQALVAMTEKMGRGEGFGAVMADGGARLAEKFGHPELFMGVKKMEAPAYDPRGVQGMGLQYATSNRGACHVRGYTMANEILGVHEKVDPLITDGKAALVITFQNLTAIIDSAGLCLFVALCPGFLYEEVQGLLNGATGFNYTVDELVQAGDRIWNLERLFNQKAGFTKEDDTLPKRLLEVPAGPGNKVCELDKMLPEYYKLRGWDDGFPGKEKLAELGLE